MIVMISTVLFVFFYKFVPFNMDEFYQYHVIAEKFYPDNAYNVFVERPSQYDLKPFGNVFLPLRSFHYTGSLTALFYFPLFILFRTPYSARLVGMIMLIVQALLIKKLTGVRPGWAFAFLAAFMPYSFSHIADTGPVSFQTTSIFLIWALAVSWKTASETRISRSNIYPALIGLLIFSGIWIKLSYFMMLPAISLLITGWLFLNRNTFFRDKKAAWSSLRGLLVMILFSLIPTVILLLSKDRNNYPYALQLLRNDTLPLTGPEMRAGHFAQMAAYLTNPVTAAHRIFWVNGLYSLAGMITLITAFGFFALGIRYCIKRSRKMDIVYLNIALFVIALSSIFIHPKTWAMHHIVLAYPFIILAAFQLFAAVKHTYWAKASVSLFAIANILAYAAVPALKVQECNDPSLIKLNTFINSNYAHDHLIVVVDWGFYFIKSLYGPKDQSVLYIIPFDSSDEARLLDITAQVAGRKILFVGRQDSESDLQAIKGFYPGLKEVKTGFDTGKWRIWDTGN